MTLIKSISGIRGTIGGQYRQALTPLDVVECVAGYGTWLQSKQANNKVVVGRDGRVSGKIVSELAINTLLSMGIDVVDLDLSTTPTVEMMVTALDAQGGIIFTASHNPIQWNALKFLNADGEFISAEDGKSILAYIDEGNLSFAEVLALGQRTSHTTAIAEHIEEILALPLVDKDAVAAAQITVVVDCINSTGAISVPPLLDALGVKYTLINGEVNGHFAHNPEPLAEHLTELSATVVNQKAAMGISIDPDVDRLAFVNEDGSMFGEEYTLVAIADYILSKTPGNTVSNLSSTRALADVTRAHGGTYEASAVGEVNVVNKMKAINAVIGGEGNGGIIVPELHYGRDALAGIALFLSHYAHKKMSMSALKASYPNYVMIKDKIDAEHIDVAATLDKLKEVFEAEKTNNVDGLKIDFEQGWVHLRSSNTEPIVRVYAEGPSLEVTQQLIDKVKSQIG